MNLSGIRIYPIKSLDPVCVQEAKVLASGALQHDREFALVDADGKVFRGKRDLKLLRVRSKFNLENMTVALGVHGNSERETFHLLGDADKIGEWMSSYIGRKLTFKRDTVQGFPDDPLLYGPTVVAVKTLEAVVGWFESLTLAQIRRRFRANLEVDGAPAFWEDGLYARDNQPKTFFVGTLMFKGIIPCERCVIVTRDPDSSEGYKDFQKIFMERRREMLPPWASAEIFSEHSFMLCLRTQLASGQSGGVIRLGDKISEV
jgi:uncharacterized protein